MVEVYLKIKPWGNDLGVRLPAAVARAAPLRADQRVRVSVEDGHIVIHPADEFLLTLEQRLAQYDPERHGGEAMACATAGCEMC
ncbi:MAG: AbrB/MazE/SpoVT family DNA-binding domain-containing protein [Thiobacillus sp.]